MLPLDKLMDNWLISALILVFINQFKTELGNIITIFLSFTRRIYKIGDKVQLWNNTTGEWGHVVEIIEFKVHIFEEKRGCWVEWPDGKISKIGLLHWFGWFKRPFYGILKDDIK